MMRFVLAILTSFVMFLMALLLILHFACGFVFLRLDAARRYLSYVAERQ